MSEKQNVRFIRKNGRIIPIRDKGPSYRTAVQLGATAGGLSAAGGVATAIGVSTNNRVLAAAGGIASGFGMATGFTGTLHAIVKGATAKKDNISTAAKQWLATAGGSLLGAGAVLGGGAVLGASAFGLVKARGALKAYTKIRKRSHLTVVK